jgi:hypothetical protein
MKVTSTDADQDIINRFFMTYSGTAPTNAELDTFANSIATTWAAYLAGLFNIESTLVEVIVEDLTSATSAVGSATVGDSGTREGAALGAGVAAVIQFKVARRYRGGHPRMYGQMGVATDLVAANQWSAAFLAATLSAIESFIVAVESLGWSGAGTLQHVNVSYYEGFTNHTYPSGRTRAIPTLRATPVIDPIETYAVNPRLGSQRRRNQQRGL